VGLHAPRGLAAGREGELELPPAPALLEGAARGCEDHAPAAGAQGLEGGELGTLGDLGVEPEEGVDLWRQLGRGVEVELDHVGPRGQDPAQLVEFRRRVEGHSRPPGLA